MQKQGLSVSLTLIDYVPMVIFGSDIPGGNAGNHTYKLTASTDRTMGANHTDGEVGYRQLMGFAKSR